MIGRPFALPIYFGIWNGRQSFPKKEKWSDVSYPLLQIVYYFWNKHFHNSTEISWSQSPLGLGVYCFSKESYKYYDIRMRRC